MENTTHRRRILVLKVPFKMYVYKKETTKLKRLYIQSTKCIMGIRGLTHFVTLLKIRKKIGSNHIRSFANEKWAVDASLFLYRSRSMCATHMTEQDSGGGRPYRRPQKFRNILSDVPLDKSHLVGIVDLICQLLSNRIVPILVFDGEPPSEKAETIVKRRSEKIKFQRKVEWVEKNILEKSVIHENIANDLTEQKVVDLTLPKVLYSEIVRRVATISPPVILPISTPYHVAKTNNNRNETVENMFDDSSCYLPPTQKEIDDIRVNLHRHKQQATAAFLEPFHIDQARQLCTLLGIQYHNSSGEAEVSCAALQRDNIVDAVYTADSDVLVYGCTRMIRRIINYESVDVLNYTFIREELDLTHEQFVRFCVLMGCDFCDGVCKSGTDSTVFQILQSVRHPDHQGDHLFDTFLQIMGEEWVYRAKRSYALYTERLEINIPPVKTTFIQYTAKELTLLFKNNFDMEGGYVSRIVEQFLRVQSSYFSKELPFDFRRGRPGQSSFTF